MTSDPIPQRPWIDRLDPEVLQALEGAMVTKRYDRGVLLFSRGDVPEGLHVLREGSALLDLFGTNGRRLLLDILRPGDLIGETFAFDGRPATVSVEARSTLVTQLVPTHRLTDLSVRFPQLQLALARGTAANFRGVLTLLEEQVLLPLPIRIMHRLIRLGHRSGAQNVETLSLTQAELAAMVGASRQAVNRELAVLEQQGAIRRHFQGIECNQERIRGLIASVTV